MNRRQRLLAQVEMFMGKHCGYTFNDDWLRLTNVDILFDNDDVIRIYDKQGNKLIGYNSERGVINWDCSDDWITIIFNDMVDYERSIRWPEDIGNIRIPEVLRPDEVSIPEDYAFEKLVTTLGIGSGLALIAIVIIMMYTY